ncbi:MAG: YbhB/YbcL family Raf kinase inhibitor-like protein [Planctomycetes bacterium]|nr:YbhB/YbcL family Raf kinase inhibitor-like protein [Planctomycetota bacterium]
MKITSTSFENGARIPDAYAFCIPDATTHVTFGANRNPQLAWSDVPAGTKSLVLLCVDPDVPTVGDDVNQEGKSVPADLPRCDFFHWVMVDIAPSCTRVDEGACSNGVTPRGKQDPPGPEGSRQGKQNYTEWFAGDECMGGTYKGYDGPAPPWNDERMHHYHFQLFATDLERCPVDGEFTGQDVRKAIEGHVLAEASWIGTYTLNPKLR